MDGWSEIIRTPVLRPPRDPNTAPATVTCALFDEHSDLVWVGDSMGYIGSFAGAVLTPYTRFPAHSTAVSQMVAHPKGILSTEGESLRLTNRRGLTVFNFTKKDHEEFDRIKRICLVGPSEVLIATRTQILRFDTTKNTITSAINNNCAADTILMSTNKRHVALGKSDGSVDIYELRTNTIIKSFSSSSGTLSDMDLKEHTLVTCGYARRQGTFALDPLVNVFDLRTLKPLSPIPFPAGASFVRLHPKLSSVAVIASKTGQMQVVDMFNPASVSLYQADVGPAIVSFELSSTGDFLSIIDAYYILHLWSQNPEHSSMSSGVALEYADMPEQTTHKVEIDDESFPLNSVGLPYYKETLLSAWPSQAVFRSAGIVSKPIDPNILKNSIMNDYHITIAPYDKDKYGRRNQAKKYVSYSSTTESGKFLSAKSTASPMKRMNRKELRETLFEFKNEQEPNSIPNAFKKLEILYSKFGIDDFDFDSYNQTNFSGLESHVDNSYTNALIQLYRFVPELFNFVVGDLATENLESDSLLTELGYLYDMMVKSNGKHYRPTNFQQTLSKIKDAETLGLLDKDGEHQKQKPNDLARKGKLFNRFLLNRLSSDEIREKAKTNQNTQFNRIFGMDILYRHRSLYTGEESVNQDIAFCLEVTSPLANGSKPMLKNASQPSIIQYIESSMNRIEQKRVINQFNGNIEILEKSEAVTYLPNVLSINLHLNPEEQKSIRNRQDWLKSKFFASIQGNSISLTDDLRGQPEEYFKEYELIGFVAEISGETEKDSHLITFVQARDEFSQTKNWFLFNDFLVIPIPKEEVFNLSYWWKTPITLVYRNTSLTSQFSYHAFMNGLNDEILYRDHFAAGTRETRKIEYELLTKEEAPQPGSIIAIDAEFVTLEEEQFEIKSNGARSLLKPSNQALARVSVLRGDDGDKFGVPFIDDYVVIEDGIHDYLTSFSGIEPGDLDPKTSTKSLVTRQTVYRKLWLLLNLGCVFVGHGLTKDFRTINICVPKAQVRDTAVFFYKGQRILSLRFLAYVLLEKKVQTGNHDSIEDAHTALLLYKEYLSLKTSGNFEEILDYIYQEGQTLKFKPPEDI